MPQKSQRLKNLNPSKKVDAGNIEAYSLFVKWVRRIVPVIVILLVIALFAWPQLEQSLPDLSGSPESAALQQAQNILLKPRYESKDRKGNPYFVTAEKALLQGLEGSDIVLSKPEGYISLGEGKELWMNAVKGRYMQVKQKLYLTEQVTLRHSDGYILETDSLYADLKENMIKAEGTVFIRFGEDNVIEAPEMKITNDGDKITLPGPVKTLLNMENMQ